MNGEFVFVLNEKEDRNGDKYLFGGLEFLNAVIFIRPEPAPHGEPRRWRAVLKPYKPKSLNGTDSLEANVWGDDNAAPSPNKGKNK
jgi:hypothetical protein